MKTRTNAVLVVLALLAYFSGLRTASAFYDPGTQRWPNHDPLWDMGFELLRQASENLESPVANLYTFVKNRPINVLDLYGLKSLTADDCNKFLSESLDNLKHEIGSDILEGVLVEIATGAGAIVVAPVTGGVGSIIVVGGGLIYGVYDAGSIIGDYLEQAQRIHDAYQRCMDAVCKS